MKLSFVTTVLRFLLIIYFNSFCKGDRDLDSWILDTFQDCTFQVVGSIKDRQTTRIVYYGSTHPIFVDVYSPSNLNLGRYYQTNLQHMLNNNQRIKTGITRLHPKYTSCIIQVYLMLTLQHPKLVFDSFTNLLRTMVLSEENPHFVI